MPSKMSSKTNTTTVLGPRDDQGVCIVLFRLSLLLGFIQWNSHRNLNKTLHVSS